MKTLRLAICTALFLAAGFAQNDRGMITGTITDPTGAVVPNAAITATNSETNAHYETVTTNTGNYTLAQLPAGPYNLEVSSSGFAKFVQQGIRIQVGQTARIDIAMQLGTAAESVTINADAPLLRTEEAEQSQNIATQQILNLPLFGGDGRAAGALGGLRSPYSFLATMPGSEIISSSPTAANNSLRVNGLPNDTSSTRIEGQESTNTQQPSAVHINPGVEAMEEVTLQGSNFAPEFGQVGAGVVNFTAKSGTNNIHGSLFEYLRNEFMNAGQPFSSNGQGGHLVARARGNNYGGSVGGPIYIPKIFNGRNRAFFFFNLESAPGTSALAGTYLTVPTLAMRSGNFSSILTGRNLGTDPLGSAILENTIYDPGTEQTVSGLVVRTPFPGNIIPVSRFDPVAAKIQALIPLPTNTGQINNWQQNWSAPTSAKVITTKEDINLSSKSKLAFYLSWKLLIAPNSPDGLPVPITTTRSGNTGNNSPTFRLSFDHTLTPTLLFHAGIGFIRNQTTDVATPEVLQYDAVKNLGLVGGVVTSFVGGAPATGFPRIASISGALGGAPNLGPANTNFYYLEKPTAVASTTWVKSNHTFKFGAEWRKDAQTDRNVRGAQGIYTFDPNETGLPSNGLSLSGGTVGFAYASFLLGMADSATVSSPQDPQFTRVSWGFFAQDSWKVSRKLTLVYGLRYDYQTGLHELWDRLASFEPWVHNPSAGGLPGGMAYAGYGTGRCNCEFAKTYKYAFQPRLGFAYQLDAKTVVRGGWGFAYGQPQNAGYMSNTPIIGVGYNQLGWFQPAYGEPAVTLQTGLQYNPQQLSAVSLDPGIRPISGTVSSPPYWLDPGGGRPGRIDQWSFAIQREIFQNLAVEVAYVGNHGVWLAGNIMNDLNALTPQRLAAAGLNLNNASDRTLLTSRLSSPLAQAAGFKAPYASFPLAQTVAQSLRPYPQFLSIPILWTPRGSSWYDALQTKLTKRFSHGLVSSTNFTWAKELSLGADGGTAAQSVNDVYNRQNQKAVSPYSQPFVFVTSTSYTTPKAGPNRWTKFATGDWTLGVVLRYQSGTPIFVPLAQNSQTSYLFRGTVANRVPGQPLFLQDLNCHCFDPNATPVLNPAAWTDPAPGQWGTSALYYDDYRFARRPSEAANLSRVFNLRENVRLEFQAMFFNILNRTFLNNPTSTNAKATPVYSNGTLISGFGAISTASTNQLPRTGLLSLRLQF
jgi:hypothetical protein